MKPKKKIELIFTVDRKTVAIKNISDLTVDEIVRLIKIQEEWYPERDYRIERRA